MVIQVERTEVDLPPLAPESSPEISGATKRGCFNQQKGDVRTENDSTMWCPSVISWFISPINYSNYSYIYHKP